MRRLQDWQLNVTQALDLRHRLAAQVSISSGVIAAHLITGVDIVTGKGRGMAIGAVVVLSYPELRIVETKIVQSVYEGATGAGTRG